MPPYSTPIPHNWIIILPQSIRRLDINSLENVILEHRKD